jgi:hypothetical protein
MIVVDSEHMEAVSQTLIRGPAGTGPQAINGQVDDLGAGGLFP